MDSLSGLLQPAFKSLKPFNDLFSGASSEPFMQAPVSEKQGAAVSLDKVLDSVLGKISAGSVPAKQSGVADSGLSFFSPQAVADRITGFVGDSIQRRAGSEIEKQSMLEQAKEGIEQGIGEARDILESLGQLSGEVEQQVDETESLIFQDLQALEQTLFQPQSQFRAGVVPGAASKGVSESGLLSSQFRQTSEAAIEIVTRDGDRVAVSYSAFIQSASSQQFSSSTTGDASAFSFSSRQQTSTSVAFQFSVAGDLDEEELDSINDLLKNMGDIAGQFFQGDVQAAFNSALELGFDSEQLKSFSLDFQQSTRVQVAQAYQRTEQFSNPPASVQLPASVNPRPAVDVLSQLENLI
ncbi:hypothetical protein MNBD_GAMMA10-139, partial [hydrothermal vent metagenome]